MSLASHPAIPLASINNETMSGGGIAIMVAVIMVSLAAMLILMFLAQRHPGTKRRNPQVPWTGPVMGGMHLGDGRSVAPHRDAPAEPWPEAGESGREAEPAHAGASDPSDRGTT